jgi:hypothetical protein
VWLNAALAPPPPGGPEGGDDGGLAAKRLEARVRGALWHLYWGSCASNLRCLPLAHPS